MGRFTQVDDLTVLAHHDQMCPLHIYVHARLQCHQSSMTTGLAVWRYCFKLETICDDSPRVKVYSITELTHLCDLEVSLPHTPKLCQHSNSYAYVFWGGRIRSDGRRRRRVILFHGYKRLKYWYRSTSRFTTYKCSTLQWFSSDQWSSILLHMIPTPSTQSASLRQEAAVILLDSTD